MCFWSFTYFDRWNGLSSVSSHLLCCEFIGYSVADELVQLAGPLGAHLCCLCDAVAAFEVSCFLFLPPARKVKWFRRWQLMFLARLTLFYGPASLIKMLMILVRVSICLRPWVMSVCRSIWHVWRPSCSCQRLVAALYPYSCYSTCGTGLSRMSQLMSRHRQRPCFLQTRDFASHLAASSYPPKLTLQACTTFSRARVLFHVLRQEQVSLKRPVNWMEVEWWQCRCPRYLRAVESALGSD